MLTINLRLIRNDLHLMISRIEDIRQNYNKNITYDYNNNDNSHFDLIRGNTHCTLCRSGERDSESKL